MTRSISSSPPSITTSPSSELRALAASLLENAQQTSTELDDLERSLAEFDAPSMPSVPSPSPERPSLDVPGQRSWEELKIDAAERLRIRGINPADVDLDSLLDPSEVARIERRAMGGVDRRVRLDRYDLLFAAAAGVAATIVDALVVGIPKSGSWQQEWQKGSWLTGWLRDHAVDSDNWLAGLAPVSFDSMVGSGLPIDGMSGRTHRVQTFGHDPVIGLVLGTLDIMSGTISGASPQGGVFVHSTTRAPVANRLEALALEMLHLLSDLPTRAGLPVPGWSVLSTIRAGSYGANRVDEWARLMYVRGYDTWHFMSMATVPATDHLVVRAYLGMRRTLDPEYEAAVTLEAGPTGDQNSGHPRFDALLLAAHGVAAAGNIGKLIAYGGNPLALNYDQWLTFFRALFAQLQEPGPSQTERLATQSFANAGALADGWVDLARLDSLPSLPFDEPTRLRVPGC